MKTTNLRAQAWQAHVPKSKNGRLEGRQRIRINTIPQYPQVSKSTTRGRQRGRRRNRPLRCEASTRMRGWMCYRNHLVRRRGSAHDTSGRCPFHITKFSPGRSCWARESYSCPEYLMEIIYSADMISTMWSYHMKGVTHIHFFSFKAIQNVKYVSFICFLYFSWLCFITLCRLLWKQNQTISYPLTCTCIPVSEKQEMKT